MMPKTPEEMIEIVILDAIVRFSNDFKDRDASTVSLTELNEWINVYVKRCFYED